MLVVISGLPGSGKSTVAAALAERRGAVHLSIDEIEDALLGSGLPADERTGIAAYEAVRAAAEQNLVLGRLVVVDAVNDSEPARETWRRAARATGRPLRFVLLTVADADERRRRLAGRSAGTLICPSRHGRTSNGSLETSRTGRATTSCGSTRGSSNVSSSSGC